MIAKIRFNNKTIEIPDVEKADGFKKFSGLMFKNRDTNALLFEFSRTNNAIHSLFCRDFLAIWLNNGKIIDYQLVDKVKFSIKPKQEFTHLLEIPVNDRYSNIISLFSEKTPE